MEPKALCLSVMFSLVCESKAGFSMRQLMKTRRCPLTWFGLSTCREEGPHRGRGRCRGGVSGCGRVGGLEGEVRRLLEPLVLLLEVL